MSNELQQLEQSLQQLSRNSRGSIIMILIGACALIGSLVYSATRLAPLEREMAEKRQQITTLEQQEVALQVAKTQLRSDIAEATAKLAALKNNIEQLYAVKVSDVNTVFELKATALATGRNLGSRPIYDFAVFINAPDETLNSIEKVSYLFDHDTFRVREQITTNASEQFRVGYTGWGCLTNIRVMVTYSSGEQSPIDFNMCKSLGPMWAGNACSEPGSAPEKVTKNPPAGADCVVR